MEASFFQAVCSGDVSNTNTISGPSLDVTAMQRTSAIVHSQLLSALAAVAGMMPHRTRKHIHNPHDG